MSSVARSLAIGSTCLLVAASPAIANAQAAAAPCDAEKMMYAMRMGLRCSDLGERVDFNHLNDDRPAPRRENIPPTQGGAAGAGLSHAVDPTAQAALEREASSAASKTGIHGVLLTAGTELEVELATPLNSSTSHVGDHFALRLAQPITRDRGDVVSAGALGDGEVIDAAPAGMGGRAGKLVLAARELNLNGRSVRINGLTAHATGKSRVDLVEGLIFFGAAAALVQGEDVAIPVGTRYRVRLAQDVNLQSEGGDQTTAGLGVAGDPPKLAIADVMRFDGSQNQAFQPAVIPTNAAKAENLAAPVPTGQVARATTGRILFFRPWRLPGAAYSYHVVEVGDDGRPTKGAPHLGELPNGSAFAIELAPGIHAFNVAGPMAINKAEDRLRLEIEPGETYYVEQTYRLGLVTAGFRLSPASEARFAQANVKLRPN